MDDTIDMNEARTSFAAAARATAKLRDGLLFDFNADLIDAFSEQYFLLALESLDQAQRFLTLANLHQMPLYGRFSNPQGENHD